MRLEGGFATTDRTGPLFEDDGIPGILMTSKLPGRQAKEALHAVDSPDHFQ